MEEFKIIDFHVHVFAPKIAAKATRATCDHYRFPSEVEVGDIDSLYKSIEGHNIVKMVVHSTATKASQVKSINDFLISLDDERFVKFCTMHPDYEDIYGELERMKGLGARGIKLHTDFQFFNADSPEAYPIYDAAKQLDMPVLFHVGDSTCDYSHPRRIAAVAADFPHLKIIGAHFGGREMWEDAALCLADKENVWFDTSSALSMLGARRADELIRIYGVDRMLFATDFPMANHTMEIKRFMYLNLSNADREKIFYKNAAKLLNL
ncbi:MAG: amidohydrolase family protein [Clostridia bacterium]|nr:amidohydrolase family protein [Clostridia bacterium]